MTGIPQRMVYVEINDSTDKNPYYHPAYVVQPSWPHPLGNSPFSQTFLGELNGEKAEFTFTKSPADRDSSKYVYFWYQGVLWFCQVFRWPYNNYEVNITTGIVTFGVPKHE